MRKKSKLDVASFEQELENDESAYLIAKKNFVISHNSYLRVIKEGEDISDVPAIYYENLKTEKVI